MWLSLHVEEAPLTLLLPLHVGKQSCCKTAGGAAELQRRRRPRSPSVYQYRRGRQIRGPRTRIGSLWKSSQRALAGISTFYWNMPVTRWNWFSKHRQRCEAACEDFKQLEETWNMLRNLNINYIYKQHPIYIEENAKILSNSVEPVKTNIQTIICIHLFT